MSEITTLTSADADLFRSIRDTKKSPEEMIPDDTDPQTLKRLCYVLGKSYANFLETTAKLKPFLGRVFLLYKKHPELYTELGYKNYNQWMTEGVPKHYGISRPEAFICVGVAEQLGHADPNALAEIGPGKQNFIRKLMEHDNSTTVEMKREKANKWIAISATTTMQELEKMAIESGMVDEKDVNKYSNIVIKATREVSAAWDSYSKDPAVQEYFGTTNEGDIFGHTLAEAASEVNRQIEDRKRAFATKD